MPIVLFRGFLFSLTWWVLTEGAIDSWLIGVPVVALATGLSVLLLPVTSWSLLRAAYFIPFFLWQSIRAGVDVARCALHPRLPISPGLYDYRLRLPAGMPRVVMLNTVSLLPGTLSVELNEDNLRVHVLNETADFVRELTALENRLAAIFGYQLTDKPGGKAGH